MKQAEKLLKNNNLQAKKKEVKGLKYMVSPIRHPYNKRLIFVEKKIEQRVKFFDTVSPLQKE